MLSSPIAWLASAVAWACLIAIGLIIVRRGIVRSGRAAITSWIVSVVLAVVVGTLIWALDGKEDAAGFVLDYLIELAFAVETALAFGLILGRAYRFGRYTGKPETALILGVAGATVLRALFVLGVSALIHASIASLFIVGAAIIYAALKLIRIDHESEDGEYESRIELTVDRAIRRAGGPISPSTRIRQTLPLLAAALVLSLADPVAWPDGGPEYSIIAANALALITVPFTTRVINDGVSALKYGRYALSVIGAFVGVRLVIAALRNNSLPFVNNGEPLEWAPDVPLWLSFLFFVVVIAQVAIVTIVSARHRPKRRAVRAKKSSPKSRKGLYATNLGRRGGNGARSNPAENEASCLGSPDR